MASERGSSAIRMGYVDNKPISPGTSIVIQVPTTSANNQSGINSSASVIDAGAVNRLSDSASGNGHRQDDRRQTRPHHRSGHRNANQNNHHLANNHRNSSNDNNSSCQNNIPSTNVRQCPHYAGDLMSRQDRLYYHRHRQHHPQNANYIDRIPRQPEQNAAPQSQLQPASQLPSQVIDSSTNQPSITLTVIGQDSGINLTTTDSDDSSTPPPLYHEVPGVVPAYQGRTSGAPPSYDEVTNPNAAPPTYNSLFGQTREARKRSNGMVDLFKQLFLILIGTLGCTLIIGFLLLIPITMILIGIYYLNECRAENIPSYLVIGGFVWIVKNILNCYNQFKRDSTTANRPPPRRIQTGISTSGAGATLTSSNAVVSPTRSSNDAVTVNLLSPTSVTTTSPTAMTNAQISCPTTTVRSSRNNTNSNQGVNSTIHNRHQNNRIRPPSLIGITSFKCESMLNYFLLVWFLAGCIVVYRIYEPDYENPMSASYCNRTVYLYAFWLMTSTFIVLALVLSCLCCLMASSLMSCTSSTSNGR